VYEGDLLEGFEGRVLNADAGASVVYAHKPVAKGAGYEMEPGYLIRSKLGAGNDEEAHMFRPSDVAVGIDGSIYVADWYDPGVGGHAMADTKAYGRILRIAPRDKRVALPKIDLSTIDGQIAALCSPAVNVRWQAQQRLAKQGEAALLALKRLSESPNPRFVARALWLLERMDGAEQFGRDAHRDEGKSIVRSKLHDSNVDLRVAAFRALRGNGMEGLELSALARTDKNPALQREIAIAMRDASWDYSKDDLQILVDNYVHGDRYWLEALGIGASGKEAALYEEQLGRAATASENSISRASIEHLAALSELAWRLHPPAALVRLCTMARAEADLGEVPLRAINAIAFMPTREAAEAMLSLALGGPREIRDYAAWWVRFRDSNDWREYHIADALGDVDRKTAKLAWTSGATKSGLHDFSVDLSGAKHVLLAVGDAGDGNSYDWSDWIGAKFVGAKGETRLSQLAWIRASAAWGSVNVGKNAEGGVLKVDGVEFADSIGTHAESEIVFAVPEGASKLVGKCGPDDGGTKRAGSKTSVEFQIYLDTPPDRSGFKAQLETLRDANAPANQRETAALELIKASEGALAVVEIAQQGKLPDSAKAKVVDALLSHSDPAVRAMAAAAFPSTKKEPSLDEIVKLTGNKHHGQEVFFSQAATCSQCHSVRGRGGDVGPDLSEIRKKYSPRELLDNVLHPSKAIEFAYQTWVVETTDGLMYTGFLQAGNLTSKGDGTVVLKDTSGKRVSFPESEVESARQQTISVMPDNVALGLKTQDLADLAAFLTADPNVAPKFGAPIKLFNGRDFDGWTFCLEDPKLKLADVWSVRDGVIHCKGRPAGYIRTNAKFASFVLELDWRWDPSEPPQNSGVLLRMTGADKVWPRAIEAQLQHRNAGDIWNIDEFPMLVDAARTDGRHTTKLAPCNEKPVGEWNHYKITLNGGDLTLEVNGLVQNTARWCEEVAGSICLQSEGSAIEFKDITLTPIVE
jgi:putative heme-binding domain-containing protein